MPDAAGTELDALRATIRERGTIRVALVWATLVVWAALTAVLGTWSPWPALFLTSLLVLAAGFETAYALHVGVERIGRYVQVFHEPGGGAAWETTAMAYARRWPSRGPDPLFGSLFLAATTLNFFAAAVIGTPTEIAVLGLAHAALVARIVAGRRRAAQVRPVDLERFEALRRQPPPAP